MSTMDLLRPDRVTLDQVIVEVECPHTVGLAYLHPNPLEVDGEPFLRNLPCPCNDRSVIRRRFIQIGDSQ